MAQDTNFAWNFSDWWTNRRNALVMGILNVTPDSFHDGGLYKTDAQIIQRVEQILNEGATIIDVGAYSTRPGAKDVSIEQEVKRLLPAIKLIRSIFISGRAFIVRRLITIPVASTILRIRFYSSPDRFGCWRMVLLYRMYNLGMGF